MDEEIRKLLDRYRTLGLVAKFGDKEGILKFFQADADGDPAKEDARLDVVLAPEIEAKADMTKVRHASTRLEQLRAIATASGMKATKTEDKADGEGGFSERLLTVTASDDSTDRYGDRISVDGTLDGEQLKGKGGKGKAKGWLLKDYARNPVFMAFHEYTPGHSGNGCAGIPLGIALDTWIETGKSGKRSLKQTILFSDGTSNPLAPLILSAYKVERIMRGVSVGFAPTVAYWPQDDEERTRLALGPWGVVFAEQNLLENSAVSIPANPYALAEAFDFESTERSLAITGWADKAKDVAPELAYIVRSGVRRTTVAVPPVCFEKAGGGETIVKDAPAETSSTPVEPVAKSLDADALAPVLSALVELTTRISGAEQALIGAAKKWEERLDRIEMRTVATIDNEAEPLGADLYERVLENSRVALKLAPGSRT